MHTRHRCWGKLSVWLACITVLLSAAFIVLIVNREALTPMQTAKITSLPTEPSPSLDKAAITLPLPTIKIDVKDIQPEVMTPGMTNPTLTELPLPEVQVDIQNTKTVAYQTLVMQERGNSEPLGSPETPMTFQLVLTRPAELMADPFESNLLLTQATSILTTFTPPLHLKTKEGTGVYGTTPSPLVLERTELASTKMLPIPVPQTEVRVIQPNRSAVSEINSPARLETELTNRLQDVQARLYLSELKIAVYEGHSRPALQKAWAEIQSYLRDGYLTAAELQKLEPELTQMDKAVYSRTAARKLIEAIDALQNALDTYHNSQNRLRIASAQPF